MTILREQLPGNRLEDGKQPTKRQGNPGEGNQESTIAKDYFQKAAFISHWDGSITTALLLCAYCLAALIASVNAGTTSNRSPTMP